MKKETTTFDALKRIDELEKENKKLKKENKMLRFDALPTLEKSGAERAFRTIHGSDVLTLGLDDFKCDYIDQKDMEYGSYNLEEACNNLSFDD